MVLDYRFNVKLNIYLVGYKRTMRIPVTWAYRRLGTHWWAYRLLDTHWPSINYELSRMAVDNKLNNDACKVFS